MPINVDETIEMPIESVEKNRPRGAILVEGSGLGLSEETNALLRDRLRLASLLLCGGFVTFLIVRLFSLESIETPLQRFRLYAHIAITITTAVIGWRLCVRCRHILERLRIAELIVFGGSGAFFAVVAYSVLVDGVSRGYVASISPMWMVLIFTYALFIPNNWRRAAIVIGLMAGVAISVLWWVRFYSDGLGDLITSNSYFRQSFLDQTLVLILTGFIAVRGVWTINTLRREAFEAKQLGQYQLRRLLGSGGMGEVYLAEHLLLKRPCAIKVIRPDRAGDSTALARFEREVRATAQLTHWNTVEIFDYGHADDGTFYYVMEYLPGMNLEEIVKNHGSMQPDRIVHLLLQVCEALREAHSHGLIHRDIKPANIFAAHRGGVFDVAKLLDFGLAKPVISQEKDLALTQDGTVTGSPLFMSPEQAIGDQPDHRSDIYSLGAVAWYLAVGRPPFERDNAMKIMFAHMRDVPERPSDLEPSVSETLDAVIMKCLEKRPEDRPQSIAELREMLLDARSDDLWNDDLAAQWWTCNGCPKKKQFDDAVLAGAVA